MCLERRGASDIPEGIHTLKHPAAALLNRIRRQGVPVVLRSAPWTTEHLDSCVERGPHKSAMEHLSFLRDEFTDFARKGFWLVLPYREVRELPGLRVSPLGVVPQDGRRPRVIVDYSYWGLNEDTVRLSDPQSMQFGRTNARLQRQLAWHNPRHGPVAAYKVDISDGFYRVPLCTSGIPKLGVLLPPLLGDQESLVAFPLVLPMGWTESPPFFCKFTETACDLTNSDFRDRVEYPWHPLEDTAGEQDRIPQVATTPVPKSHSPFMASAPLAYMDVYVDDFCGVGQDHPSYPLKAQRRALLHNIDKVFRPNATTDSAYRKQPISIAKRGCSVLPYQGMPWMGF